MIRLYTGLPGAGKTAHAVSDALEMMKLGRPVFVSNMNGMNIPGAIPFEDPRKWEELPSDAVLIVDEAQRFWRATRTLDIAPEVLAMETHRHLGIDFLLTTQQPTYLVKHLRGLVGEHTHHLRRTKASAQTWTWKGVCEDPDNLSERDRADVSMFVYPKQVFGMYTSTEKDTHRPGIPRKWKFVGAAAAMMLALFIWGPDYLKNKTIQSASRDGASAEGPPAQPPGQGADAKAKLNAPKSERPATLREYVAELRPRVGAAPWSAPIFDEREVVAKPELYCVSAEGGTDAQGRYKPASHTCLTEQGTTYELDAKTARGLARHGNMYNPFRQPEEPGQEKPPIVPPGAGWNPAAMTAPAVAPVSGTVPAGEVTATYGAFRGG